MKKQRNIIVVYKKGGFVRDQVRELDGGVLEVASEFYSNNMNLEDKHTSRLKWTFEEYLESLKNDSVEKIIELDE